MSRMRIFVGSGILAVGLAGLAAWLAFAAACLFDDSLPLCRHPAGGWIVVLVVAAAGVVLPLALVARERARRALARGMYARPSGTRPGPGAGMGAVFENVLHLAIEGEWPRERERRPAHPLEMPKNAGWAVALDDGTVVYVYLEELWQILNEAWLFQYNEENRRQGPTSQRRLDPVVGRAKVQAINYLLDISGATRRNKATPNSTRRLTGTPWTIISGLCRVWPPSELK